MPDSAFIVGLVLRLPVVLFALTIHEFMHGWTAYKCGDDTAYRMGRLTLNPLAHLDPIGTLCLLFAPIGWAKPVPINFANLAYETRRRDEILITGAGIASNAALAVALAVVARVLVALGMVPETQVGRILWIMMGHGILLNFGLAIFNLLPIHPLDGSHILRNLLPLNAAVRFQALSRYGPLLLLGVVLLNMTTGIVTLPVVFLALFGAGFDAAPYLFPAFGLGT